uniref:Uncharacterized protein n=1 Tax=Populus davidiana TaxID=266767 RepID=A0A6M2EW08_9ROSI
MASRTHQRMVKSKRKMVNNPTSYQCDNIKRFLNSFSNGFIAIERGLGVDLCAFEINTIFEDIGSTILFYLKKVTYPKLIITRINVKIRIVNSLQGKRIEWIVKYL